MRAENRKSTVVSALCSVHRRPQCQQWVRVPEREHIDSSVTPDSCILNLIPNSETILEIHCVRSCSVNLESELKTGCVLSCVPARRARAHSLSHGFCERSEGVCGVLTEVVVQLAANLSSVTQLEV